VLAFLGENILVVDGGSTNGTVDIASRLFRSRHALVLALVGLLPGVDALLRIHRWVTRSLVLTALVATATVLLALCLSFKYFT